MMTCSTASPPNPTGGHSAPTYTPCILNPNRIHKQGMNSPSVCTVGRDTAKTRTKLGETAMHKDLRDDYRPSVEGTARGMAISLHAQGQSLALAREAWINAFDKAAEELEA